MIKELLMNRAGEQLDTNKGLAFVGALVGGVILIIATLKGHESLEWLLSAYLLGTLGQLPSKGLHDLKRLKLERGEHRE